jgi:hypothetical protein
MKPGMLHNLLPPRLTAVKRRIDPTLITQPRKAASQVINSRLISPGIGNEELLHSPPFLQLVGYQRGQGRI